MNTGTIRRELLEAARTFILKDPDHFSIAALCRETGIRKSQLRTLFPTKNDLMSALVEESEHDTAHSQPANPFPADEAWVKNRFTILERALTLLEDRTEEIVRGAASAANQAPDKRVAEPPPVVIAPGTAAAPLEIPPLPIEKPRVMFDARKMLGARVPQPAPVPPPAKAPITATLKKMPGWIWTVAAVWAGAIAFIALLMFASKPAKVDQKPAAQTVATKPAPVKIAAKPIVTKKGDLLVIDATGTPDTASADPTDAGTEAKAAIRYLKGDGVDADPGMAMRYGQNAAAKGNSDAAFLVGALYAKGMAPDAARAAHWYRRAAERGHPKAMYNLAMAYLSGYGVTKDAQEAVSWLAKAADAGYADAAVNLGVLYETGRGVARDRDQALTWYRRAAGLGDGEAAARVTSLERAR